MDGVAAEQRQKLETIEEEQVQVKRWLDRLYRAIETTDLEPADMAAPHQGAQGEVGEAANCGGGG